MTQVSTRCTARNCHWVYQGSEAEGESEFSTHRRLVHLLAGQYAYSSVTRISRPPKPPPVVHFTNEQILAGIRSEADGNNPPTIEAWRVSGRKPTWTTVITRFGSWNAAIRAAGLEPRERGRPPSDAHSKVTPPPRPVAGDRA